MDAIIIDGVMDDALIAALRAVGAKVTIGNGKKPSALVTGITKQDFERISGNQVNARPKLELQDAA